MFSGLLKYGISSFLQKKSSANLFTLWFMVVLALISGYVVQQNAPRSATWVGTNFYRQWWGVLLTFFLPIFSTYTGVGLLRDEVESKTLTYIWTRPCGRLKPLAAKWAVAALLSTACAALAQATLYGGTMLLLDPNRELLGNLNIMAWDGVAVVFCVIGYMSLGLAFATLGKRANQYAVIYVLLVDSLAILLPGELSKVSLKVLITALSASGAVREGQMSSVFDLINKGSGPVSESEALVAWALIVIACWVFIAFMLRTKEIGVERVVGQT